MNNNNRFTGFIKKYWIILITVLLVLAVAFSSIEIYKEEVLHIEPDVEYVKQNTLYMASERLDTLNPIVSQSADVYSISKLIYGSLFRFDENLGIVNDLVESYDVNTEKAYINITLKKGVKWHDGSKLKPSDVVFTVNAIKAAGQKSQYYDKARKIVSCYQNGSDSVAVYFNNNYNCSLDDLTFPIVCGSQYGSVSQFINAKDNFKPVGTGQYKYKSYNRLKFLKLVPNASYYGDIAETNLTFNLLPDRELAPNLMEINNVICYTDSNADRKSVAADKKYKIYDFPSNNVDFLVFNTKSIYTGNKDFRQAVAYAVDSKKILQNAYMNDGILTDTIYYPDFMGVNDSLSYYERDMEKSLNMFRQAGYYDKNSDGFLKNVFGDEVVLRILVNKNNATRNSAARIIKENLEEVGINSEIMLLNTKDFETALKKGNYDIMITGYSINENYDLRDFFNGKTPWKYQNYELLSLVRELDRLYTSEQYKEKYSRIKEELLDELPYYPLCYKKMSLIGNEHFEAGRLPTFNNIYMNVSTWSWQTVKEKEKEKNQKNQE